MPLSEQEQRLLEEMERSLYHNDADFVAAVTSHQGKPTYSAIVGGVLVGVLGVAVLITGVIIRQPLVGVLGFVVMFVGVLLAITPRGTRLSRANAGIPFGQDSDDRWGNRPDETEE